jgi:hypothetical protein
MTSPIQFAYWGASGNVSNSGDYQKIADVTRLAQELYAQGLRVFQPNVATWSPGKIDPDPKKTKALVIIWSTDATPSTTVGAVAFEHTDESITLP